MVPRRGYTLIEMTVVMGIITVLSTISVIALVSTSGQSTLDQTSEQILSMIRDAQSRSISIYDDPRPSNGDTKAWSFFLNGSSYGLQPLNLHSGGSSLTFDSAVDQNDVGSLPSGMTASLAMTNETTSANNSFTNPVYFSANFSSPFGRTYLLSAAPNNGNCIWNDGGLATYNRPAKDWFLTCTANTLLTTDNQYKGHIVLTLSYKGKSDQIYLSTNGDIYAM